MASTRLEVLKTYKIFIGGQFPRTESGRYFTVIGKNGVHIAHMCLSSRKDFRNAVVAARSAFAGWSNRAAFNRGQILYRIAEMLEGRKAQFIDELMQQGYNKTQAVLEVTTSVDRLIYYAGWCDKYQQLFSTVNPVASPHFNFSVPEPMGVVTLLPAETSGLLSVVSLMAPAIAGGNTVIIIAGKKLPLCAITLAEVIHSSDVPAGVVNILTGEVNEIISWAATHLDVNAIVNGDSTDNNKLLEEKSTSNLKRIIKHTNTNWLLPAGQSPYFIMDLQEIKTTWHPVENIAGSGGGY